MAHAANMLQLGAKGYVTKSASHQEVTEAIINVATGEKYIDLRREDKD